MSSPVWKRRRRNVQARITGRKFRRLAQRLRVTAPPIWDVQYVIGSHHQHFHFHLAMDINRPAVKETS